MNDIFVNTFIPVFYGIIKIFIVAGIAGVLVWKKVINEKIIDGLSLITVYVFLPALIFTTITTSFDPGKIAFWWLIPIGTIAVGLFVMAAGALLFIPDLKNTGMHCHSHPCRMLCTWYFPLANSFSGNSLMSLPCTVSWWYWVLVHFTGRLEFISLPGRERVTETGRIS